MAMNLYYESFRGSTVHKTRTSSNELYFFYFNNQEARGPIKKISTLMINTIAIAR